MTCNAEFQTAKKNLARGGGKYCSRKCNPLYQPRFTKAEKSRRHNLSSKYGLTEDTYFEMLVVQGGGCKICGAIKGNEKHEKLFVDHCHKTNIVRGLLCGRCNSAISLLRDCPETIRAALFYVLTGGDVVPTMVETNEMTADMLYDHWLGYDELIKMKNTDMKDLKTYASRT